LGFESDGVIVVARPLIPGFWLALRSQVSERLPHIGLRARCLTRPDPEGHTDAHVLVAQVQV